MRTTQLVLTLIVFAAPLVAQQSAPAPASSDAAPAPAAGQYGDPKLHQSAMKFLQASDARQRTEESMNKLLSDGRQALLARNQGLDPRFADEWLKRMKQRVRVDDLVNATAQVYEKYFTSSELDELTDAQLAMKRGQLHTIPGPLAQKLKAESPHIQRDINLQTSLVGARLGKEVGQEIEREHPEWGKNTGPAAATPEKETPPAKH
jgi:hypothetical protein